MKYQNKFLHETAFERSNNFVEINVSISNIHVEFVRVDSKLKIFFYYYYFFNNCIYLFYISKIFFLLFIFSLEILCKISSIEIRVKINLKNSDCVKE